ncbi:MAG: hypothetical protein HRT37_08735 [Alteromonadaceae bacterium]|nr:hypothetical protein [Alteromonadaceae bacterium]
MKVSKRQITEARLKAALQRLLDGKPEKVKASGKLTLNRINNEAGLSASYIHKFPEFIEEAEKAITAYQYEHGDTYVESLIETKPEGSTIDKLKARLKNEIKLKKTYKEQRDAFKAVADKLVEQEASLIFRVYELQEEIRQITRGSITPINR